MLEVGSSLQTGDCGLTWLAIGVFLQVSVIRSWWWQFSAPGLSIFTTCPNRQKCSDLEIQFQRFVTKTYHVGINHVPCHCRTTNSSQLFSLHTRLVFFRNKKIIAKKLAAICSPSCELTISPVTIKMIYCLVKIFPSLVCREIVWTLFDMTQFP